MSIVFNFDSNFDYVQTIRSSKGPVILGPNQHWWSTRTPDGPGTLKLVQTSSTTIEAQAWGPGDSWLINQTPKLLGDRDDINQFQPTGKVEQLWKQNKFKLGQTGIIWDSLVGAIFGQKVQVTKAKQSINALKQTYGELAPGPKKTWLIPSPDVVSELGYSNFHKLGIERKRADTLIRLVKEMPRIAKSLDEPELLKKRLQLIKGIGPWTIEMTFAACFGDPDTVPTGDFHIPNIVAWHLAAEPRADDKRMLELLEPYKGQRWRVIRILKSAGSAPKYGPRLSLIDDGMNKAK